MNPYLSEALRLAGERKGFTAPNPAVGAVLVKNGQVIGRGFHWASGAPHAEVEAFKNTLDAEGASLYVTLEPCCHFGKTPPCTNLIIEKKISEVVYGYPDPNPKVAGRGVRLLKEAGVKVVHEPSSEIDSFYRKYAYWTLSGKTWLTGKLALTKDLKTASGKQSRLKITGRFADEYTHVRRKEADVLVTSQATIKCDDPLFNVRLPEKSLSKPVWILDRNLEFSVKSKVKQSAGALSLVFGGDGPNIKARELGALGIELISLPENIEGLDVTALAPELGRRGFHEAWIEFGYRFFGSFLRAQQFQEVVLLISNTEVEDTYGPEGALWEDLKNYERVSIEQLGPDRKEIWLLKKSQENPGGDHV